MELVSAFGRRIEEHTLTTDDGYILKLHKMPGASNSGPGQRLPVLLLHGILGRSDMWVLRGPPNDLGE